MPAFSLTHTLTFLLAIATAALSGCTLPMKGKLRTDVDAAPPTGENVVAIKATDIIDRKAINRDELKPLLEAVAKMDHPVAGCWAFTKETIFEEENSEPIKNVTRYDPAKPPAEMIDLILVKNLPPTEEQKKAVAERSLKAYDKFHNKKPAIPANPEKSRRKERTMSELLKTRINVGSCHMQTDGNILKYTILTGQRDNYRFGSGAKYEYLVDTNTTTLVAYNRINLVGMKMYGAISMNMEVLEEYNTYAPVPGSEIPILVSTKTVMKMSARAMGVGGKMNGTTTRVFTNHKKVTCYDDRFSVTLGDENILPDTENSE